MRIFRTTRVQDDSDEACAEAYRCDGDMEMLGILFARYSGMVFGVCLKYLRNPADSEDATMAIFESLTVKLKTHQVDAFRGWLYVVSRNHCLQILRSHQPVLTEDLENVRVHSDSPLHPEDGTDWQGDGLQSCMESLPPGQRQSIELFYYAEKSYEQIAAELMIDRDLVRSHIQNGRRNLKHCMEQKARKYQSGL